MKKVKKFIWIAFVIIITFIAALPAYFNLETETLNAASRVGISGEFIQLPQGITHYQEVGPDTAQTVLLVPGFSVPYHILDPTFDVLRENGFHVIRFNLFGRGYSDRPDGAYDQQFYTKQIADLLMALDIDEPIDIVGLSMGAPVSVEFAVNHPQKVNKVVLIGPIHEPINISILSIPFIGEYVMNVFFAPSLVKDPANDFYQQEVFSDWPAKFNVQMKYKGFKKAILSTLRNYISEDKLPAYKKLGQYQKSVLLIWGEKDKDSPYVGNERIRAVLECEFLGIEKAGHLVHCEKPELVNERIIGFLNK